MSTRKISNYFQGANGKPPAGARVDIELAGPVLKEGVSTLAVASIALTVAGGDINSQTGYWEATVVDSDTTGQAIRVRESVNGASVRSNAYNIPAGGTTLDLSTQAPVTTLKPYTPILTELSHRVDTQSGYWGHDNATSLKAGFMSAADKAKLDSVGVTSVSGNYTSAGTGAVARSITAKLGDWLSVMDFGAVGDGVTNDATAINNAITAAIALGKGVLFPGGKTYLVNSSISIPSSGSKLFLLGYGATLKTTSNVHIIDVAAGADFVTVEGLSFLGDSSATYSEQRGVQTAANYGVFRRLHFKDLAAYGYLDVGNHNLIEESYAENCYSGSSVPGDYGAYGLLNCTYATIRDCVAINAHRSFISLSFAKRCLIKSFKGLSTTSPYCYMGIYELDGSEFNTFEDVTIENVSYECFDLRGNGGDLIKGCNMFGDASYGLSIANSPGYPSPKNVRVIGLNLQLTSGIGIHVSTPSRTTLSTAALNTDTVLNVASASNLSNGMKIRIADGTNDVEATIQSIAGTAVTLIAAIGTAFGIGATVYDPTSDVTFENCYVKERSVTLREMTRGMKFVGCVFDNVSLAFQDSDKHEMTFIGCTWKNFNNTSAAVMGVTNALIVDCLFHNIKALSLFGNSNGSVKNVRVFNCKTFGTNTITRVIDGLDNLGLFTLDGNYFLDIPETHNYTGNPPVIMRHNGKVILQKGGTPATGFKWPSSMVPTAMDAPQNANSIFWNDTLTVSSGKILLGWASANNAGTMTMTPIYVTTS